MKRSIFVFIAAAFTLVGATSFGRGQNQSHQPGMSSLDSKDTIHRGEAVFKTRCAVCHYASSSEKKIGPGLHGISRRERLSNGQRVDSTTLTRIIEGGGKDMPPLRGQISDAQMRDLLAYIRSL
jgi:cytochrome c